MQIAESAKLSQHFQFFSYVHSLDHNTFFGQVSLI